MELLIIHSAHDRMILLVAALLLSWIAFGPFKLYRSLGLEAPEQALRRFITACEIKLNRTRRNASTRIYRGMLLLIFVLIIGLFIALVVHMLERRFVQAQYLELFLVAYLIPSRHVWDLCRRINPLMNDTAHIITLRRILTSITNRHSDELDIHSIARFSIDHLMEQFATKVVAPVLWFSALGLPALILLRLVHLLNEQIGRHDQRYFAFGWSSRHLNTLLQFFPSLLAGVILCLAAWFIPKCRPLRAISTMLVHGRRLAASYRCWPIAAAAGALHITLGGPHRIGDDTIRDGWVGTGTAKANLHHLVRAQWLYIAATIMLILLMASILMLQQKLPISDIIVTMAQSLIGSVTK